MSKLTHLIDLDPAWLWKVPLAAFLCGALAGCCGLWLLVQH